MSCPLLDELLDEEPLEDGLLEDEPELDDPDDELTELDEIEDELEVLLEEFELELLVLLDEAELELLVLDVLELEPDDDEPELPELEELPEPDDDDPPDVELLGGGGDGDGSTAKVRAFIVTGPAVFGDRNGATVELSSCRRGHFRANFSAYQNSSCCRRAKRYERSRSTLSRSLRKSSQIWAHSPSGCCGSGPWCFSRQRDSQADQTPSVKFFRAMRSWFTTTWSTDTS